MFVYLFTWYLTINESVWFYIDFPGIVWFFCQAKHFNLFRSVIHWMSSWLGNYILLFYNKPCWSANACVPFCMTKYSGKNNNNKTNHDKTKRQKQTSSKNKANKKQTTKTNKYMEVFWSTLKYLDIWWKLVIIDQEMFKEKLNSSRAGKSQDTFIWVQKLRHFGTKVRESGNKHFWSLWSEQIIMYYVFP